MDGQMKGVDRGGRWRVALPVLGSAFAVGALAEVSGTRADDHYALSLSFPWWGLVAAATAVGLIWWALRRRRPEGPGSVRASPRSAARSPCTDPPDAAPRRIAIRSPKAITLVDIADISHVEADGRYARIHAAGQQHLSQYSLGELERSLDDGRFVRVHRSAMVNLERIRSLRTHDYRDFELRLEDGTAMRLSRTYRDRLEAALGLHLGRSPRA